MIWLLLGTVLAVGLVLGLGLGVALAGWQFTADAPCDTCGHTISRCASTHRTRRAA